MLVPKGNPARTPYPSIIIWDVLAAIGMNPMNGSWKHHCATLWRIVTKQERQLWLCLCTTNQSAIYCSFDSMYFVDVRNWPSIHHLLLNRGGSYKNNALKAPGLSAAAAAAAASATAPPNEWPTTKHPANAHLSTSEYLRIELTNGLRSWWLQLLVRETHIANSLSCNA